MLKPKAALKEVYGQQVELTTTTSWILAKSLPGNYQKELHFHFQLMNWKDQFLSTTINDDLIEIMQTSLWNCLPGVSLSDQLSDLQNILTSFERRSTTAQAAALNAFEEFISSRISEFYTTKIDLFLLATLHRFKYFDRQTLFQTKINCLFFFLFFFFLYVIIFAPR